ncbi:MAG: hypothetical protein ACJ762_19685 [Solirubrobacteraceae bacterium]
MIVEVDLAAVPPTTVLREPDDFTSFKVVVRAGDAAWVPRDALLALAGDRAAESEWTDQLGAMLEYAATRGWIDEHGSVKAHIEFP